MATGVKRGKSTTPTKRKTKKSKPNNNNNNNHLPYDLHSLITSAISAAHSFLHHDLLLLLPTFFLSRSLPPFRPSPPDTALASALFRLSHGASYKSVVRRFGFDSSADACRVFYSVCKAVNEKFGNLLEFRSDIARILIYSRIEESRELLNGPSYELSDGNLIPRYILGDSCFALLPWFLTPYIRSNEEDSFGSAEREFNSAHGRAMGLVGNAFGRVKARWQLLSKRWKEECVEFYPLVIITGCLLHNFLIKCREPLMDDNVGCSREEELPVFEGEVDESGRGSGMHLLST